jgi:hypothetical protein
MAFAHPVGITLRATRPADTARAGSRSDSQNVNASRVPYVVWGAIAGGLAGAGVFAYEIAKGLSRGGEWMALPTIGAARYVGGGLVLGGFLGLVTYYVVHPD